MFVVESKSSNAARKMSYLMLVASLAAGMYGIGLLLTMHFYVRPGKPAPARARLFGFPAPRMRKLVPLVMSGAMVVGGLYVLAFELLWAARSFGALLFMGAMLVLLGAYLLWTDFIASALGIKTEQARSPT
jgi:hypothetical protein